MAKYIKYGDPDDPALKPLHWDNRDYVIDAVKYGLAARTRVDVNYGVRVNEFSDVFTMYGDMAARVPPGEQIVEGEVISKRIISDDV